MDIKQKANTLAKKYGTRNPFEIINHLNIIVIRYPLKEIRGFYQYFRRNNIIYINENLTYQEQLFVCAHELGHMLLHKQSNALFMNTKTQFITSKFEIEANKFAVELLIDDDTLEEYKEFTTEQLSRLLGYDRKLIELRMK